MKRTVIAGTVGAAAALTLTTIGAPTSSAVSDAPGLGWTAAIQHQTGPDDDQGRLVLAKPGGGIVPVGEVSDGARIVDVSQDARHVVTVFTQGGEDRVTVWDTVAKKGSHFRVAEHSADLALTDSGVLQIPREGSTITVRDHAGAVTDRYAATALNPGRSYLSAQVSPDGKHLIEATDKLVVRDAATGAAVASSALPEKQTTKRVCDVERAWGNGSVAVQCGDTDALGNEKNYRVSWSDGTTAALGTFRTAPWPTSSGIVYDRNGGEVAPAWVLKTAKGERSLSFRSEYNDVVGSRGNTVDVLTSESEGGTLVRHDVSTGDDVTLAGTEATGGGLITDAWAVDGNQ